MYYRENKPHSVDIPLGLSMAAAQNPYLFGLFANLTPAQREELAGNIHNSRKADTAYCTAQTENFVENIQNSPQNRREILH